MKPLNDLVKKRLIVLWVLLNSTTEYEGDSSAIVKVMRMIENVYPQTRRAYKSKFKITFGEEVIFEWDNGTIVVS